MKLHQVCTIQIGYTARARLEPASEGVLAIQLRDIGSPAIALEKLIRIQIPERIDRYLVQSGDILFRSRGENNVAAALNDAPNEPIIAVSPLMTLRPKISAVLPDFLVWSINQPKAQRYFDLSAQGTNIRMISKSCLDDLHIDLPDIETQKNIVAAHKLALRETELLHKLADKKRDLVNLLLSERAHSSSLNKIAKRVSK